MEQRLFIVAVIMYVFSWISKKLFAKNKIAEGFEFGIWHALFLFIILNAAHYVLSFVINSGSSVGTNSFFSVKNMLISSIIVISSVFGFYYAKGKKEKRESIIKADLDWANTVYFAGFVASIVMFFFVQAFKIPSASMENTLLVGDHLFVPLDGLHIYLLNNLEQPIEIIGIIFLTNILTVLIFLGNLF